MDKIYSYLYNALKSEKIEIKADSLSGIKLNIEYPEQLSTDL